MPFPHLGAFESTKIFGSGQDLLDTTGHLRHWREDLDRLDSSGIRELRYPVPWHRIEQERGVFDWNWIDGPMRHMQALGMQPILDPLHHVSFPDWLENGFANPLFPQLYTEFVEAVARRYEWVDRYTVVNEPLPTLVLCALTSNWYPYRRSDLDFVTMTKNVARAICLAGAALQALNPRIAFYHIDSCEHHTALDAKTEGWTTHANLRRFLFHDLTLGLVDKHHPLCRYLTQYGFTQDDLSWFADHAGRIDVIGLDYYAHQELEWKWDSTAGGPVVDFPCKHPLGFAAVAQHYVQRFQLPVMLTETNVGGTTTDRLTWLKFMEEQSEQLAATADFRGFCWFPSVDATDWDSLCTVANKRLSPMGLWSLDVASEKRRSSELSDWYVRLARGECSSRDLPAYLLHPPLDDHLKAFVNLMHPDAVWRDPRA